ncbi:MAG: Asp-tRNA(Asn)/Glu-tRNA(Gln) amidotransferase subunit GatC [Candidatus Kerfeldbacteria bacterium]|nr:Asp-tRNA(Asn)/Glu-tRNA(Gln) amidotransferase subunit GatC [Candidatus Kerfeldbacteria bacterium]
MEHADELIRKLSDLARLDLTAEEQARLGEQLPKILEYVGQLREVRTEEPPQPTTPSHNSRPDDVRPSGVESDILAQAPDTLEHYWKVDSVF